MSLEDVVKRRLKKQQEEGQRDLVEKLNARIEELEKNPSKQEEQKSGLQIFQGGGFSGFDIGAKFRDGYQIGDVAKTGLDLAKAAGKTYAATVGDVWTSAARGLGGVSEGIGDALTYITAGIMDATDGTDKKGAADRLRKEIQKNYMGDLLTMDAIDKNSLLGSTSKAILEGVGQGVATQSAAGLGGPLLSGAMMFVSGLGNNMTEAYQGGATDGEAAIYGLATGAWDAITETLSGGLGKGAKALGVSIGIGGIDDMIASGLTKNIKNKVIANLIQGGVKAVGEGLEELLSYGGQVVAKKLTYLSEKDWAELWNNQEALENFVVGMMSSAIMQAPDVVKASQAGRDFVTGRTDAEQTVIDKVYKDRVAEQEKGGKKLTTKEKGQILDAVEQAYERGEIAVEDIEAALGGETYRKYTEATKQQEAMQAEFDKLNGMKKSDMTGAQEDRLQELRQQLETMKTEDAVGKLQVQYLQEAWAKVGSGKLAESYNQREQRRQAFQADLESYDAKQRAIVQKAIDSGILNNTRKSHEFVDLVAKIGAETGTDFDFTNSKKLRESGFALEGVTVNGFTDGKTVTVNINSAKALNTVVGHEIMHVLEGTELAGKLQEQLFAYAKTKGEFDKRRADLETLYAGRDADIDRELAADLVGDYLFTDIDFVRNLKAGNRNLFQRVYDEIKHLVKLATAGSKEARELEKVKKLFEDVYREAGTEKSTAKDGGVEYSVSQKNDSITDPGSPVKMRITSETESQQFKRWFGDWQNHPENASKIVNADGTPKVMYHGTSTENGEFYVFDTSKAVRKGGLGLKALGEGNYFTAKKLEGTERYGSRVIPAYLDIKRPFVYSPEKQGGFRAQAIQELGLDENISAADIQTEMRKRGYDGVIKYGADGEVLIAVTFDSTQIKSATDNVGTFDGSNPDIRYSLSPEADRAYMDAVENANMDAAQVMVDEAAKQAGFTEEVYHGTRRGFGFTKYDPNKSNVESAFFTSGDLAVARTYSQDDGVTNISLAQELGLTAGNYRFFANTEGMIEIDAKGGVWDAIRLDQELQDKLNSGAGSNPYDRINPVTSTNELAGYAKKSGYRVVKITNVYDQSMQPGQEYHQEKPGSVYIFLYPNEQLRSADPVTYDDKGNVIPLSQRFNPQSGDFRESLSRAGETAGFDDSQIYGRDVALEAPGQKAPVAGQPESKATGMEAPTAAEMSKAQTVEAPVAEEKPVQTAQEEAKAEPAMEAPTAAEMPGEKPVEAPVQEDAPQSKLAEIDMQYEAERDKKQKLYEEKRDRLMEKTQSKDNFFKETALRLYEEIKGLKKGVKASQELRPLLDQRESMGMSWEDLRSALLMVERKPDGRWNPNFEPEAVVRLQMERLYKNATDELAELEDQHDREMKALENAAKKRKEALQASQAAKAAERPVEKPAESILTENFRAEAPKEGMQPVVSPVVKGFGNRPKSKKPKREQMTQEEAQYYEQTGETPVTSFRELMEGKIVRLKEDIKRNWDEKRKVAEEIDKEIQKLQLEYDGLKNKTTKRAQWLLHRIDERKRAKADRMAEANKRYHELSRQIQRTEERLRNDTGRADWLERKLEEIDSRYEAELEQMKARHEEERSRMMEGLQVTKQDYFRETAVRLYDELTKLKKGVAASPELSFVLDEAKNFGFSWREVKATLLSINRQPSSTVDQYSELETVSREYFDRLYQNYTEELESIIAKQDEELRKLQEDAEEEKQTLRASQVKKDVMEQFEAEAGMLVGYTGGWKDFNTGYGYNTQTMRRFMREVVRDGEGNPNIERADAITDYLQETYSKNHAALNLEAKKRKDKIRELGLNQHESVYTQMLGELRHNPRHDENLEFEASEYLKEFQDKIDLQKVENAVEVFRAEYEDLFVLINNTLRALGMKEMPYHKGYFPHFEDRTQTWMQKLLNWKPDADQIPTTIAGKTEGFKPVRTWQRFSQKRKGERTDYDAIKGYDTYLDGALDWIYHMADIQRMRSFENYLRYIHSDESTQKRIDAVKDAQMDIVQAQKEIDLIMQESKNRMNNLVVELQRRANLLAGKKYTLDREMEYDAGRPSYARLTNITGRTSANQVAGNLASAVTNVIPIIQSWAQVSPVRSIEAAKQTIEAIKKDDGIVEKSTFLTNRLRQNESLIQKTWDKIGNVLTFPMELMDSFASQVVWRSMYIDNIQKGMPEAKAIAEADRFAAAVIADRSKGTMPTIFAAKNPIYKAMTTFQLEPANQMGYFFKDLPIEIRKKAEAEKAENGGGKPVKTTKQAAAGVASVLVGSYVYNLVMEALTGNTPATDPIRMLENIIRNIWSEAEDDDEEEPIQEAVGVAGDAILELVKELPYIGGIMGGGRISSTAALPYGSLPEMLKELPADFKSGNYKEILKEMLNLVYYGVLPMGGGQIKKINEGIGMYLDPSEEFPFLPKIAETPGSYTTSGNLRFAVEPNAWNVLQSILFGQYANANAREYFDEGRSPLSPNQVEEFSSVDMSMSEYWDYRDALKAAGDKTADKMEVVMGLDLPVEQKNILANNIVDRKDPIDLTGAEDFGSFAEFDFFNQHRKKYDFLKGSGVPIAQYLTMEAANNALKEYEPGSEEMQKFLKDNNLTLEKCQALQREKQTLDFRYNSGEKKYAFLITNGISVQEFEAMSQEEKDEVNMLYENPKKLEFLRGKGITAAQYKDLDKVTKEDLDFQYKSPEKYSFLQKNGISVADYSGFDEATKDAWDTMAKNPKKYEFLKKQGVTVDQYKLFNQGWKDAWNWAYNNQDAYLVSQGVTKDLYAYRRYVDKINGISGDKRKSDVWKYIQGLDLSNGAKMLLFKQEYPKDDTYDTEIVRYVQSLGMTYAEKKRILEKLGF